MKIAMRCFTLVACAWLTGAALAAAPPLVTAEWLQQNLGREGLVLLDASFGPQHGADHIPGAVNVDVFAFGGREVAPAEMERRIRSWGVSPGRTVVLYDQGASYLATSLFFDLYYHGFPAADLRVLDGGLARWKAIGGAVTREKTPPPAPGTFEAGALREEVRVRLPEFLVASGDPDRHALVEALDPGQHFGGAKFFDRAGHIPNAIMSPVADYFNADKTFKSPAELRRMLGYLGIDPAKQVLSHCGGGIAASVPFFAAKFMLGYPRVKLYKESQLEWLRDDRGLPFWTYDAPQLVRDRAWLHGWGNATVRRYGVSRLSVIDVRPEAAYRQSHLPFAIHLPAETFRRHLADPAKLAAALAAAGVDATHEAVVVSQGGLTPDGALAFLLLESLGQKRVSVLADSVDEWGFAGLPLEKEAGAATPSTYAPSPRAGIVMRDARDAGAAYPRVYVASGKGLPAATPQGTVIHVPYAGLLDEKGAPRAAKDIWAALAKAGLPRYAEIVTVADDPGEAAANYFILKLMGYPDVKVLLP